MSSSREYLSAKVAGKMAAGLSIERYEKFGINQSSDSRPINAAAMNPQYLKVDALGQRKSGGSQKTWSFLENFSAGHEQSCIGCIVLYTVVYA